MFIKIENSILKVHSIKSTRIDLNGSINFVLECYGDYPVICQHDVRALDGSYSQCWSDNDGWTYRPVINKFTGEIFGFVDAVVGLPPVIRVARRDLLEV